MTRLLLASALLAAISAPALAQGASCKVQSADKHLSGAALASFSKRCERDAATACDAQAGEKNLRGAAKASFTKKCVRDAVGT